MVKYCVTRRLRRLIYVTENHNDVMFINIPSVKLRHGKEHDDIYRDLIHIRLTCYKRPLLHCPSRITSRKEPNSSANRLSICRSTIRGLKRRTNYCAVYPLSVNSVKRQQYFPQTVLVRPWSPVSLQFRTEQLRCKNFCIVGTKGGSP
jgi:hypothetical protein